MSSQDMKFIKSVFSTMNYLLYGPIALTGTRPLTRPFIQRQRGTMRAARWKTSPVFTLIQHLREIETMN